MVALRDAQASGAASRGNWFCSPLNIAIVGGCVGVFVCERVSVKSPSDKIDYVVVGVSMFQNELSEGARSAGAGDFAILVLLAPRFSTD